MITKFYNKHPRLLVLTFLLAIIGTFALSMFILRMILLVEFCYRNPIAEPGIAELEEKLD